MKLKDELDNATLFKNGYASNYKEAKELLLQAANEGKSAFQLKFKSAVEMEAVSKQLVAENLTITAVAGTILAVYWLND